MPGKSLLVIYLLLSICGFVDAQSKIVVACQPGLEKYYALVRAVYADMGFAVEFSVLPSERALVEVNEGRCDAEIGRRAGVLDSYENLIYTTEPLVNVKLTGWIRQNTNVKITVKDDLKKFRIGYIIGNKSAEVLVKELGLESSAEVNVEQLAKMLEFHRIDLALMTQAPDATTLDRVGERVSLPVEPYGVYHIFNRKNARLGALWDKALRAIKNSGRYELLLGN